MSWSKFLKAGLFIYAPLQFAYLNIFSLVRYVVISLHGHTMLIINLSLILSSIVAIPRDPLSFLSF